VVTVVGRVHIVSLVHIVVVVVAAGRERAVVVVVVVVDGGKGVGEVVVA